MSEHKLNPSHLIQLKRESGINEEMASKANLASVNKNEAIKLIGLGGSGIAFPYYNMNGSLIGHRIKQDNPSNDNKAKYLTSKDSDAFIYFPDYLRSRILESNTLIILEGEKKLLKFLQEQQDRTPPTIALAGCWMYRKSDQEEFELHPVLEDIVKNKTEINLVTDSDYFQNHKVNSAYNKLAYILFLRGIKVQITDIRLKNCDKKIGVDDFLMVKSLQDLLQRINSPFVTFQNLSSNDIVATIKSDGISDKTIEKIFNSLAFLDQFQIAEKIDAIKTHYKFKQKDLLAHYLKSKNTFSFLHNEESPENYIKYNSITEGHDVLLKRIGKVLSTQRNTYLKEDNPNKLILTSPDFSQITTANTKTELYDLLGNLFVIELIRNSAQGEVTIGTKPIDRDHISILFSSIAKYVICPYVSIISKTPFFVLAENKIIYDSGYNQKEKLILVNSFRPKNKSHSKIQFLLDNTPFRSQIDKENYLGILLTGIIFKNSLPGAFPSIIIRAQEHGSGKSQLASSLQYLIEGKSYGMITYKNDVELEKHLAAQIESSSIIIDNLRQGNLDSTFLEKLITDPVTSYRRLCTQEEIVKVNNTLVILTMNGGGMSADLTSRCIVIELDKINQKKSLGFSPVDYVRKNRKEIIEEAIGMVEKSNLSKKLEDHITRFPEWEKLLKNTMNDNGYSLFLTNLKEMHETIDQNLADILNLVIRNPDYFSSPRTAKDILTLIDQTKKFNEQTKLSTSKIGHILSGKFDRKISFMAFDNLRYEFIISRKKDSSAGGNNNSYSFKFSLLRPVASVALIDESNISIKNIIEKEIIPLQALDSQIAQEATACLFERGIAVSPGLIFGNR